jgi:hypothetical protein
MLPLLAIAVVVPARVDDPGLRVAVERQAQRGAEYLLAPGSQVIRCRHRRLFRGTNDTTRPEVAKSRRKSAGLRKQQFSLAVGPDFGKTQFGRRIGPSHIHFWVVVCSKSVSRRRGDAIGNSKPCCKLWAQSSQLLQTFDFQRFPSAHSAARGGYVATNMGIALTTPAQTVQ